MKYKYETESKNYEDFASGRVLYNQKGATAFPVRLAGEIFLRSKSFLETKGVTYPFSIYDPCCGGAYLLTILGFLYHRYISMIFASDINDNMIELAKRNLGLLRKEGINRRIEEIEEYVEEYKKPSHQEALKSAVKLKEIQNNINNTLKYRCFKADALKNNDLRFKVDLLITDLPYGKIAEWSNPNHNNIDIFLNNMLQILKADSIVTIITKKKQKVNHNKYNRIKHFTIGKRRISFLEPLNLSVNK
ncbi:MAG TPA: hypothetical protein VKY40_08560 [Halanaerobiales bacterium]|nr:hypothetical protein [Halanaerobiales bacterium]